MFFTAVNPMDDKHGINSMRLGQAKDRTITKILGDLIKIQCIDAFQSSLRRKDYNFIKHDHTQSFLCNTLPANCIEKAACMKTKEELQSGQQDQHKHEAKKIL